MHNIQQLKAYPLASKLQTLVLKIEGHQLGKLIGMELQVRNLNLEIYLYKRNDQTQVLRIKELPTRFQKLEVFIFTIKQDIGCRIVGVLPEQEPE